MFTRMRINRYRGARRLSRFNHSKQLNRYSKFSWRRFIHDRVLRLHFFSWSAHLQQRAARMEEMKYEDRSTVIYVTQIRGISKSTLLMILLNDYQVHIYLFFMLFNIRLLLYKRTYKDWNLNQIRIYLLFVFLFNFNRNVIKFGMLPVCILFINFVPYYTLCKYENEKYIAFNRNISKIVYIARRKKNS